MIDSLHNERLYTKKEFEEYLKKLCSKKKLSVNYVVTDKLGNEFTYGQKEEREANQIKKLSFNNGYGVKIEVWDDENSADITDITEYESLFNTYWNNEYSDKTTGLPTTEHTVFLDKCNKTLKYHYENKSKLALIMTDLDHFREVNNQNNHKVGSKVLGEFASLLFSSFFEEGIIIHQTGDEFNILIPYTDLVDVIDCVKKARDLIKTHVFDDAPDIKLSMSVGIKCIENEELDFIDARTKAEVMYSNSQKRNTTKQRDSIRIDGVLRDCYGEMNLKFAWTRMISNLDYAISNNVYLEYIKQYSKTVVDLDDFDENISEIIEWINPQWDNSCRYSTSNNVIDTVEQFSAVDLCLAIMQGLLKNPNYMENKFVLKSEKNTLSIAMDDSIIYKCEKIVSDSDLFEGVCLDYYRKNHSRDCKRVLLVQAGYDEYQLSEDVFYKLIRVDTRPTTGGGLPDFWAATLCELITTMEDYPLVSHILIYGKIDYTRNIIEVLKSIGKWEEHEKYNLKYISQKTFKSIEDISKFKEKFQGSITICHNKTELYNKVCQIYSNEIVDEKFDGNKSSLSKRRILQRDLAYEKIMLQICDGCHVKTIADAYPIVLEILRNQNKQNENNIKDQAGRKLLELTDFKIVLSEPDSNELPDYYIGDEQLLNDYYDKIFGDDDSLFRKELMKENQLEAMIKHVVQALGGQKNYATRRAVLVVANEVKDEDNFSPLGLISIWLAPRFVENCVVVDFSYNWRTVEAVVGLPLSMYASVKFAEEIINLIKEKATQNQYSISIGSVSYIAHSLHMFLDIESMDIVRGIINDASI